MVERMTIEIPPEFMEALRAERFQKRTTYREIFAEMFANRYGFKAAEKRRKNTRQNCKPIVPARGQAAQPTPEQPQ